MTKEYTVKGMHCNGCRTRVVNSISDIDGVTTVKVDLQSEKAIIDSEVEISLATLQAALPESFSLQ